MPFALRQIRWQSSSRPARKVLGVITKGASSDHASIALLKQYKMTQRDMKVLYFSRQQDALAALDKGIVSAAVLSAPTTLMARRL
jgi:hypothetical protein